MRMNGLQGLKENKKTLVRRNEEKENKGTAFKKIEDNN